MAFRVAAVALCLAVAACAGGLAAPDAAARAARTTAPIQTTANEDIFVVRTTRASTVEGATPECAAAPFPVRQHDTYDLHGVETDAATGLVTDPLGPVVGGFNGCLGEFRPDGAFDMFTFGALNGSDYGGLVHCQLLAAGEPVEGALLIHCEGKADDPPEGYVGGLMISNSMAPTGGAMDVPGYTTTSIIVMRLWRAPPA